MLPFLKSKDSQGAGVQVVKRQPDQPDEAPQDDGLEAAAQDLISAIRSGDARAVASALEAAFGVLESRPHEESPLESDEE